MWIDVLFIVLGAGLLWYGADYVVDSASAIAAKFRISELVVGLTIVAMGTSLPEFMVTFLSAIKGLSNISVSNVVGSNIFNLGIILGTMALIRPLRIDKKMVLRDGIFLLFVISWVMLSLWDLSMGRIAGIGLLLIFGGYLFWIASKGSRLPIEVDVVYRKCKWWDYPRLGLGVVLLALGANLLVEHASTLARYFGLSEWFIGVTIVAAGTSLPELATSLAAAVRGRNEILVGNLIGSDIFNFAGVLGITALIHPLTISPIGLLNLKISVIAVFGLLILMRTGWRLSRWEGALLVSFNILRWLRDYLAR
ncbi:cation:H+ antiporter [Desulfonauticus submarinus]|uniref:Cation:H+ antiporter n=1 Tax=Desulfonauticus submarinus TaxID=206665 RepID=A0A1H0BUS2_9BACT|nr:calcium/sodium antiporter [Desulfonauticus submarinus]SDN49300.1 cation:H+ antiporter [Desulfonauticus submarinus]